MRIGIITMFYNSSNYGGILQSYSLVKALEKRGITVEQISYNHYTAYSNRKRLRLLLSQYFSIFKKPWFIKEYIGINRRRRKVIKEANKSIKHSKRIYTERNIKNCLANYDVFITGSDQVWHGEWPAFFLSFVPKGTRKIAYAVSTGKSKLSKNEIEQLKVYTDDFTAISVRESDTAEQLKAAMPDKNVQLVLDPTLILDKSDWDEIATERQFYEKYLFCYFLGSDIRMRELASEYARLHCLKVVTIPHMQGRIEKNDLGFGDYQSFDAIPQDFLSYIKYSDIVFTDSFHAMVFSTIYEKEYIVFGRTEHIEMNNRLETMLNMLGTSNRFINEDNQFKVDYIESLDKVDYSSDSLEYEQMKTKSINFLMNSLR